MVGSEFKVGGLSESGYGFYCRIEYITYQGGLLLGRVLFPSVGGQSE